MSILFPQRFRKPGARAMPPLTRVGERYRAESDLVLQCAASAAESERTKKVLELMDGSMHSSLTPTLERGGRP
jgi:hypothetical protein